MSLKWAIHEAAMEGNMEYVFDVIEKDPMMVSKIDIDGTVRGSLGPLYMVIIIIIILIIIILMVALYHCVLAQKEYQSISFSML
jgi:hypothetical protein